MTLDTRHSTLESNWTLLAWNGVGFDIPSDWTLAAAAGDRKRGSLRVEDDYLVRAEVAWQPVHRKRTIEQVVESVRRQYDRSARKRRRPVDVDETGLKLNRRDYRVLCVRPRDDRAALESLNLVYRCVACTRAVLAGVYYRPSERKRMTEVARRLFESLYDHTSGKDDVWSAYGVSLEVPTDFELARSSLRVGLVDLSFARKDWQIDLVRSALAEVQIAGQGLGQWFVAAYARRLKNYTTTTARTEFRGHAALAVEGATTVARSILRPLRPRERLYCRAWHCQVADKLFIFRLSGPKAGRDEFDRLLATVVCHE